LPVKKDDDEENSFRRIRLPREKDLEQFGLVTQLMGTDQIRVLCADGKERQCRIPGKLRKRVWIRQNDIVIIRLWDFQPSKADIVWRFFGHQVEYLKREGRLKGIPI